MALLKIDKLQSPIDPYFPWAKEIYHRSNPNGCLKIPAMLIKTIAIAAVVIFEALTLLCMLPIYLINYCWSGRNVKCVSVDQNIKSTATEEKEEAAFTIGKSEITDEDSLIEENKKFSELLSKAQQLAEEASKRVHELCQKDQQEFPESYAKNFSKSSSKV